MTPTRIGSRSDSCGKVASRRERGPSRRSALSAVLRVRCLFSQRHAGHGATRRDVGRDGAAAGRDRVAFDEEKAVVLMGRDRLIDQIAKAMARAENASEDHFEAYRHVAEAVAAVVEPLVAEKGDGWCSIHYAGHPCDTPLPAKLCSPECLAAFALDPLPDGWTEEWLDRWTLRAGDRDVKTMEDWTSEPPPQPPRRVPRCRHGAVCSS